MVRWAWVGIGVVAGCGHTGGWQIRHGTLQSISGPQPYALVQASGQPSSYDFVIECAADGLQLAVGGPFTASGASLQFDGSAPLVLPTLTSRRGLPVVDLRAPIAGRAATAEQLLVDAARVTVRPAAPDATATPGITFDVSHADRAIAKLGCPAR